MGLVDAKKPNIAIPDDFEDEAAFLADMRDKFAKDESVDKLNREAALEDMRFFSGDQWTDDVRSRREAAFKPVLTVNRLPAFVAQVTGARRLNETTLKVVADNDEDAPIAKVREGLIRSIQKLSRADVAYDKAFENAVICGIGNFQVRLDFENDDVFEQKIVIDPIFDPLAVVWDYQLRDPTGADAEHVFVQEVMSDKDFKRRWPWAVSADLMSDINLRGDLRVSGWASVNTVRVASYWRMRTKKRTLALMNDGRTLDITDNNSPDVLANIVQRPSGEPIVREVNKPYAQMYICSGLDVLEGPYNLDITRVPVFRVPGWEVNVGEWRQRWGLVRFLKDPQRLHNYYRSVIAEKLQLSPRAKWIAPDNAVQGRENEWRQSHLSDDPLLVYSAESGNPPTPVPPAQLEPALLTQAELTAQDLKDVSNIHEANLGMPSNEVSGAAIMARQRVSDTGTIIYQDNLAAAQEQCGVVINQLIPAVYDTPRIVKVLGQDSSAAPQIINDANDPRSVDITVGKYDVSVTTGPSFATKRMEAVESMMTFINAAPQIAGITLDLVAKNLDWPGAEEFVRRIRMTLPPEMVDPKDMTPEEMQIAQQKAQAGQQQAQLQQAMALAELQAKQAEAALSAARARNFSVEADLAPAHASMQAANAASQDEDRKIRAAIEAVKVSQAKAKE